MKTYRQYPVHLELLNKERKNKRYYINRFTESVCLTLITFLSTDTWFSSFTINAANKIICILILNTYPFKPTGPGSPLIPGTPESPTKFRRVSKNHILFSHIPFKPGNPLSPGGPGKPIPKEKLSCIFILLPR